jgi:hypothetical protein
MNKQPEMTSGHQLKGTGQEVSQALGLWAFTNGGQKKKREKKAHREIEMFLWHTSHQKNTKGSKQVKNHPLLCVVR